MRNILLLLVLLGAATTASAADETFIRRVIEAKLNGARVDGIQPQIYQRPLDVLRRCYYLRE